MHRGVRHLLAPEELPHRLSCAPESHRLRRDAVVSQNRKDILFRRLAVHDEFSRLRTCLLRAALSCSSRLFPDFFSRDRHRADAKVLPHGLPVALVEAFRQMYLPDHGREDMAVLEVEVVVRPVQVGRHHCDVVRPVLDVEALAHLQPGDLRDGVRLIGVFERGGEEAVLLHRLRRLAWVDAGRAEEEQLLHPVSEALSDDVLLYLEVLPDEVRTILQVGHYPSDMCRRKHHRIRPLRVEELPDRRPVKQIELRVRASHKICISPLLKIVPDGRAHEPAVPRHIYLCVLVKHGVYFTLRCLSPDIPPDWS